MPVDGIGRPLPPIGRLDGPLADGVEAGTAGGSHPACAGSLGPPRTASMSLCTVSVTDACSSGLVPFESATPCLRLSVAVESRLCSLGLTPLSQSGRSSAGGSPSARAVFGQMPRHARWHPVSERASSQADALELSPQIIS